MNQNVTFTYDRLKDIWCLAHKGKSSNNSANPTKTYLELVESVDSEPSDESIGTFIDNYLQQHNIATQAYINQYQTEWLTVADEYHKRAQEVFGVSLEHEITAYLTINSRCPYNIDENYFYVWFPRDSVRKIVMHELWHFYTWYGLGSEQEERLGEQTYNDIKEALTVLLNDVCPDLMPEGTSDAGYPQHQELQAHILESWQKSRDIKTVWKEAIQYVSK